MFAWLREYLEIRAEFRERRTRLTSETVKEKEICDSCETLKEQISFMREENRLLLNKIVKEPERQIIEDKPPMIAVPKNVPWNVRRQMLEKEDRVKAQLMKVAPKPDSVPTVDEIKEFEQELDNASKTREAQKSS